MSRNRQSSVWDGTARFPTGLSPRGLPSLPGRHLRYCCHYVDGLLGRLQVAGIRSLLGVSASPPTMVFLEKGGRFGTMDCVRNRCP